MKVYFLRKFRVNTISRSSQPLEVIRKKLFLKISQCGEYCEIFKNVYFENYMQAAAFAGAIVN